MPGIQVATEHHQFIFPVSARDFRYHVVLHRIIIDEFIAHVQFKTDVGVSGQEPDDTIPLLEVHSHGGDSGSLACLIGTAPLHKYRSASIRASTVIYNSQYFLLGQEVVQFFLETLTLQKLLIAKGWFF